MERRIMVAPFWTQKHYPGYATKLVSTHNNSDKLENDDSATVTKNDLGLFQAT